MALAQKQGCGREIELRVHAGHGQQRVGGRLWQLMREQNYASDPDRPARYLASHRLIYEANERGGPQAAVNQGGLVRQTPEDDTTC